MTEQKELSRAEWLAALKAGDLVGASRGQEWVVAKVERTTKTLVIMESGRRFKRDSGVCRVSVWEHHRICPLTKEIMDAAEHRRLAGWLQDLKRPPLTVLRAMKAAHDKETKAEQVKP